MYHQISILKPEYLALAISVIAIFVSVIAICVNVYIAWKNRKYALAKEEYFKLKQVAENIISKLLILEGHREKLKVFFENQYKANQNKNSIFIDVNNTFDKADFEKDGGEIAAQIEIYFNDLGKDWNSCLEHMSGLFTLNFILSKKIEINETIDWQKEAENFNTLSRELNNKPKEISDKIKKELIKFKEKNLI